VSRFQVQRLSLSWRFLGERLIVNYLFFSPQSTLWKCL
jgi:hypothetical protein